MRVGTILALALVAIIVTAPFLITSNVGVKGEGEEITEGNFEAYFLSRSADGTTSPFMRLSSTPSDTRFTKVASNDEYDPNYIVVLFTDNLTGQYDWYFTKSQDGGSTWTDPEIAVDPDFDIMASEKLNAAVAMEENGMVHLTFARYKQHMPREGTPTGIYYARYDGAKWSSLIPIYEDMSPGQLMLYHTDIIVGRDGIIHVAYGSDYPGHDNGDIWYCKSLDGGNTWSDPVNINSYDWMDVGYTPSLAADDYGFVYYAVGGDWYNQFLTAEMYFRRSANDGDSWENQMVIGKSPVYNDDRDPILMCDNAGGVYTVYSGDNYSSLKYKYSLNHGTKWTPSNGGITLVEDVPDLHINYFAELDDHGFIHIIYCSSETGVNKTYYMKIDTFGNIVIPPEMITSGDCSTSRPTGLSIADDRVYVAVKHFEEKPLLSFSGEEEVVGLPGVPEGQMLSPLAAVSGAAIVTLILTSCFAGGTEVGKYRIIPLFLPLYSRLKKNEVLDHYTRSRIYEYIRNNPGDHYNNIKQKLELNNGSLAYHLKTLEREKYIKSKRDGIYKLFYPVGMKIPSINEGSIHGCIIQEIIRNPGITQREISVALNTSQQVVSYHVNLLMDSGRIRSEKRGKTLRYFFVDYT